MNFIIMVASLLFFFFNFAEIFSQSANGWIVYLHSYYQLSSILYDNDQRKHHVMGFSKPALYAYDEWLIHLM